MSGIDGFQSCYSDVGKPPVSEIADVPEKEPFSITEVEITDEGSVWVTYCGPQGLMVTEGELNAMRFMSKEQEIKYALHLKNTRARIDRSKPYPHQWIEN